jgi:spermidine/putrescine-binding protein
MIHKLYNEGLLLELDFDKIPNYGGFDPNLEALRDDYFHNNQKYAAPYFWGTLGIMYNDRKSGLKELVEEYEWEVFFNSELTTGYKIGMYNSSRDAIAVAELFLGIDVNSKSSSDLKAAENLLKQQNYYTWGTDDLKEMIAVGNLDIALVYSGDFFDMLYATLEDELEVTYNLHVPNTNNIWFDALVIPKTSENVDLAHDFINFMLDPDNAYQNAVDVGYCPTQTSAYEALLKHPDYEDLFVNYPFYPGTITNGTVYEDLGQEIYQQMEIILSNAKS